MCGTKSRLINNISVVSVLTDCAWRGGGGCRQLRRESHQSDKGQDGALSHETRGGESDQDDGAKLCTLLSCEPTLSLAVCLEGPSWTRK